MLLFSATFPAGFAETPIPSGGTWTEALGLTFANDGRLYVWERGGRVWFKEPAETTFSLLLDISEEVGGYNDLGLLGFALDPDFSSNGYIYLLYDVDRHHLLHYGTPDYSPIANEYFQATIARLTRYTCSAADNFHSVDPASRLVLIGETKETGFPVCTDTQAVGSLLFGTDGTLLASCGDAASAYTTDTGGAVQHSYAPQALIDGIIRPKEDIGSFRAQLVDCLNGKIIRIDPATGNGLASNPYYDPANPRSARSRVWALGFRNPFRMILKPESGSHNPAEGTPGTILVGDVGHEIWESLGVITRPGQNFGWPIYEGLTPMPDFYTDTSAVNRDAPNPLYPAAGCSQFFTFQALLKEDTLTAPGQPPFTNPCNTSQRIPSSIPQFLHARPVLDWSHGSAITRTPTFGPSGEAQVTRISQSGSTVAGSEFRGNCSIGGVYYSGSSFPVSYQKTYFHADWGQGWIKNITFDQEDHPVAVRDFLLGAGFESIASLAENPVDGSLYYILFDRSESEIRRIAYVGNRTPVAIASASKLYGPSPLVVQFANNSSDPDNQPLTYQWNFGDNTPLSNLPNPSHTFAANPGIPTPYTVTLTVTDSGGLSAQATMVVSVNNTPPLVEITSPIDGTLYSPADSTLFNLTANVSDAEFPNNQLRYQWQTLFHHNDHNHGGPPDTNVATMTLVSPTRCDTASIFYYRVLLTVTDPAGLSTTREVQLYPDCGVNTPPVISDIANRAISQDRSTGPIEFFVGDAEKGAGNLQVNGFSSNQTLLPDQNIIFGGSGSNRTVTVTPNPGQTGLALITVHLSDGPLSALDSFVLAVNPPLPGITTASNSAPINLVTLGPAAPYPSYISVPAMGGLITDVTLTLFNLSHRWTPDVDILLLGSTGQKAVVCSDAGSGPVTGITLTFSDAAPSALPQSTLVSGTYRPADYAPADTYPNTPPGTAPASLSVFDGLAAGGNWALYVVDDGSNDSGAINGGWGLTVTTAAANAAPAISPIADVLTFGSQPTAPIAFTVTDTDTPLAELTLTAESSDPQLVPAEQMTFTGTDNNRALVITPAAGHTGTALIGVTVNDGQTTASSGFVLTVGATNEPPVLAAVADRTIRAGYSLFVTNAATDPDLPQQTLSFSLPGKPEGAGIDPATGLLSWRPLIAQAGSTNLFRVLVADDGAPSRSASQEFFVTVTAPSAPTISLLPEPDRQIRLSIHGDPEPDYILMGSTNLTDWVTLLQTNSPVVPFDYLDSDATNLVQRFYRVLLGP